VVVAMMAVVGWVAVVMGQAVVALVEAASAEVVPAVVVPAAVGLAVVVPAAVVQVGVAVEAAALGTAERALAKEGLKEGVVHVVRATAAEITEMRQVATTVGVMWATQMAAEVWVEVEGAMGWAVIPYEGLQDSMSLHHSRCRLQSMTIRSSGCFATQRSSCTDGCVRAAKCCTRSRATP
jgi:hypothetical protein